MGATMGDTFTTACPCLRITLENGDRCLKEWPPVETMSWATGALSSRWDYTAQPPAQLRLNKAASVSAQSPVLDTPSTPLQALLLLLPVAASMLEVHPYSHSCCPQHQRLPSAVCVSSAACHGHI